MELLRSITPAQYCQAFYLLVSGSVLAVSPFSEDLLKVIILYGPRSTGNKSDSSGTARWIQMVQKITSRLQVPHGWFTHFYIASTAWSVFWIWQFISKGSVMQSVAMVQVAGSGSGDGPSVDIGRVVVALALMLFQGIRRTYESFFVTKHGKTPMMVAYWVLGMMYYLANSIAVWIEGSDTVLQHWASPREIAIVTPRNVFGVAMFLYSSYTQNRCHRHLASLKKYTLPTEGWFKTIVSPHYTAECVLYLALAFVAAPPNRTFNMTLLCNVVFAVTNLSLTARSAKKWYAEKFGAESVKDKWCLVPFVY